MSRGNDSHDIEFATALAASTYAIHSIESQKTGSGYQRKASSRKDDTFKPAKTVSVRKPSQRDTRTSSSFSRPTSFLFEDKRSKETSRGRRNADSWEEAQMLKIQKRYEKMHTEIQAWEKEKKMKEKLRLERRESEMETRKSRNIKDYQMKISRIDHLADGAKAKIEEKRKVEVSAAKEKARKMRSTGKKISVKYCFCF